MKRLFNILATFLIVVVLVCVIGSKNIMYFVDIPSLALVVGITNLIIISSVGVNGFRIVFRWIMNSDFHREEIRKIGQLGCLASLGSGSVGSLIGMVLMLQNLSDPSALGPGMAISALPGLYGILIALVIFVPLCFVSNQGDRHDRFSGIKVVSGLGFIAIPAFAMGETFLLLNLAFH